MGTEPLKKLGLQKYKKLNKASLTKKGFTLVEVLLTLGIIGVVAAITIPNLVQNSQNRELVSGLKKTYNTLTNGFKQSEVL
ncbi:MAG: hypothetical protein DKM22_05330, partial [Candidatus Melainabacteria bacterium]